MRNFFLLLFAALVFFSFSLSPAAKYHKPESAKGKESRLSGVLTRSNFQDSIRNLYQYLNLKKAGLDFNVFNLGIMGYYNLKHQGRLAEKNLLTIIDFTKPSTKKRFYLLDLDKLVLRYHTYVAHGKNTGGNQAEKFSNTPHSNQSSLGFYVTGETYVGSKGYSLRLDGMEPDYNDNIRSRAVVIHAADYVSESWIKRYGRLGRSQGCPALPNEVSNEIIDTIKNKTVIFAYFDDSKYLASSPYLDEERLMGYLDLQQRFAVR